MTDTDRRVRRALEGEHEGLHSRVLPLDDIEILSRAKGGDGRTVVAYAASFGRKAEIHDQDGHYTEENDPGSFHKSVAERGLRFGVFYHHGKTLHGTPSERGSVPLGRPVLVKPDGQGLLTHTAYNRTSLADEVLESIRNGDPMGMSFTGAYLQSDPPRAPYYSRSDGSLQHVVRKEIALIEYGPTPMPAYADAAILGVRAAQQREAEREDQRERESVTLNGRAAEGGGEGSGEPAGEPQEPDSAPAPEDSGEGRESSRAATARHEPINGTHSHPHPAYGSQGGDASHTHEHAHAGDASHAHFHDTGSEGGDDPMAGSGRAASMGEVLLLGDGWVQDPDGTVRYDPDGDGDDDSTPSGDTDHDYWDPDGNPLQDIPPRPAGRSGGGPDVAEGAQAAGTAAAGSAATHHHASSRSATVTFALCRHFRMTAEQAEALSGQERALLLLSIDTVHDRASTVDRSPWDAAKAWAAGAASDDPAAFYNAICAGKKSGDPGTQAAHALPHHYAPGDPPNADGVRNSLSRLPQTDGLTNAAAAKAHLQAHMNVISPGTSGGDSGT